MSAKATVEWVTKRADEIEKILARYPQKEICYHAAFVFGSRRAGLHC